MVRLSSQVRETRALREKATAIVQRECKATSEQYVADRVGTHLLTVRGWNRGEGMPSRFIAKRIIDLYPTEPKS